MAAPEAFADGSQVLVLASRYTGDAPLAVASLASGTVTVLGDGDAPAGDPQSPGAFVAVPGPPAILATPSDSGLTADSRVELRQPGRPPAVLATSAALETDLGASPAGPVALVPLPDPSGDKIAVVIRPVSPKARGGIVVLNRAGQKIADSGLMNAGIPGTPAWSADGQSLAWLGLTLHARPGGQAAEQATPVIWHLGSAPQVISGHAAQALTTTASQCVWSPAGTAVACSFATPASKNLWAVTRVTARAMTTVPAPGMPLAWLPAGGSRS